MFRKYERVNAQLEQSFNMFLSPFVANIERERGKFSKPDGSLVFHKLRAIERDNRLGLPKST
jgi:hypothetical protein